MYTQCFALFPSPLGTTRLMSRASKCGRRRGDDGSFVARQITALGQRMDYLELRLADLTGEGTKRVLDRMHELEEVTRRQCNDLLHGTWYG